MLQVNKVGVAAALLLAVGFGCPLVAQAADHGTPEEAIALARKAIAHYQEVGKSKALEDFTNDKATFNDRDLYVACINDTGLVTAHGMSKSLVGRDMTKIMDADGRSLGNLLLDLVKTENEGWLDYRWPDPVTKKLEQKHTFNIHIDDQICGVGIYN